MLFPGFLALLSDFVASCFSKNREALNEAMEEFELEHYKRQGMNTDNVLGLFSEWLVFDRESAIFGNKTGLEYFIENPPPALTEHGLSAYRDLTKFTVGLFEIIDVTPNERVTLADMDGNTHSVFDINMSVSIIPGQIIWSRIAPIDGVYHAVGSIFFTLPATFGTGMKKMIREWGRNTLNARKAAQWMCHTPKEHELVRDTKKKSFPEEIADIQMPETVAAQKLDAQIRDAHMNEMFTSDSVKKWTNRRLFSSDFPTKAMYFLMPEDISETVRDRLLSSMVQYINNIPRSKLRGKTPNEAKASLRPLERSVEMNMFSYDIYISDLEYATETMHAGDYKKAYNIFSSVIRKFFDDKIPAFVAFRIYTNAAISCFMDSTGTRDALGCELIRASLRLNPRYDFGLQQKKRFVDPYNDMSHVSKRDRKRAEKEVEMFMKYGIKQYHRTPFRRYEEFLAKCGISLNYETRTKPTTFQIPKQKD